MSQLPATGMPLRGDRIHRYVTAFCPRCHADEPDRGLDQVQRLSGYLSEADGQIWLVRGCPRHGKIVTLYDEHPEILRYLEEWTAPTKRHTPDTPDNFEPIPNAYLRGLGEMQTQHTCILLVDIVNDCNLRCPTCFADSAPNPSAVVPIESVLANLDQRLAREGGHLDVVMLSGGEPTLHPQFIELVKEVISRDITRVIVNTNGIKIAQDDAIVEFLSRNRDRVELYLQFDGLRAETHRHHRGADLRRIKTRAVERISQAGIYTTLTMTASLGINDDEIGDVVQLAMATPYIGGVSIQPQFGSGRSGEIDPLERLTHTGVLARLEPQTDGLVTWHDLTALPCSHPHCCSVGYMLLTDKGEWRSLVSIMGADTLKANLGLVSNRIADWQISDQVRSILRDSLLGLLSEQTSLTHPSTTQLLRNVCDHCDLGLSTMLRLAGGKLTGRKQRIDDFLSRRVKRITVKPFMDMNTMIEERLVQCCVHVGSTSEAGDHQCAPFCAVQAWAPLGATRLSARFQGDRALKETLGRRGSAAPSSAIAAPSSSVAAANGAFAAADGESVTIGTTRR